MEIVEIEENGGMYLNELLVLYRRGKPDHIKKLYEEGEIYINTINLIRRYDDNPERSDIDDGILSRDFLGKGTVTIAPEGMDFDQYGTNFDTDNFVIATDHIDAEKGNIYCLTGLYKKDLVGERGERTDLTIDTKSLGDSLIVIHRPNEFIQRVLKALKENGFENVEHRRVEYHPHDYSGKIGFFRKHERFAYQKEYRFFVPNNLNDRIMVYIGSIKDIASIENNTVFTLTYDDGKRQVVRIG